MTWVPAACTLPSAQQPVRVAEFDELFAVALREVVRHGPTRVCLHLAGGQDIGAALRDLLARESRCCSFFTFDLQRFGAGWRVDVRVPPAQESVLDALVQRAEATRSPAAS